MEMLMHPRHGINLARVSKEGWTVVFMDVDGQWGGEAWFPDQERAVQYRKAVLECFNQNGLVIRVMMTVGKFREDRNG